jgi:hypothetical protein
MGRLATRTVRVTEALAVGGAVDYSFCTEEAKWRGSETAKATALLDLGRLKRCPREIEGRLEAWRKFKRECHFVPSPDGVEVELRDLLRGIRGRADRFGLFCGKLAVLDQKNGAIRPAVELQLCLYAHMRNPDLWWERVAVELREDGTYNAPPISRLAYHADLQTAHAFVRVAQWKLARGLARLEK